MLDLFEGWAKRDEPVYFGQHLILGAEYTATDLDGDASYTIRYRINGFDFDATTTSGRDGDDGEFTWYGGYWTAPDEPVVAEVWLDIHNDVIETDETDNYFRLEFTPVTPDIPSPFVWPIGGEQGVDWQFSSYPKPGPEAVTGRDTGIVVQVVNPEKNSLLGVPLYAPFKGEVRADLDDQGIVSNGFVLKAEGGYPSFASTSVRRDSLEVVFGQQVEAGQLLGYVDSGTFLSFRQQYYVGAATVFETLNVFAFQDIYLQSNIRHPLDQIDVSHVAVSNYEPHRKNIRNVVSESAHFAADSQQEIFSIHRFSGVADGRTVTLRWYAPDGTLMRETSEVAQSSSSLVRTINDSFQLPENAQIGRWRVELLVDDVLANTKEFLVSEELSPEIRIEFNGDFPLHVANDRFAPIEFAAVEDGEPIPDLEFQVFNHGNDELLISNVRIPYGFILTESLDELIEPGQSDTFSIEMDPAVPAHRRGQIIIESNDEDESEYSFSVEGAIGFGTKGTYDDYDGIFNTRIGTSLRKFREGDSMFAKVHRHGPGTTTYQLTYHTDRIVGPEFVTIGRLTDYVRFEIQAVDNAKIDPDDFVRITAKAIDATDGPIDNLISTVELFVSDTPLGLSAGNDVVTLNLTAEAEKVVVNGDEYSIDPSQLPRLNLNGGEGFDQLVIQGDQRDNFARISGSQSFVNAPGFVAWFRGFENIEFIGGGGNDSATLVGGSLMDARLDVNADFATFNDGTFDATVRGVNRILANADHRANTEAFFEDTPRDDYFFANPDHAFFSGDGKRISANGFRRVTAESLHGGNDTAQLIGTDNDDEFFATMGVARIRGDRDDGRFYRLQAFGYDLAITRAKEGNDVGEIFGSTIFETLVANDTYARINNSVAAVRVDDVEELVVRSGGGNDHANVYGTDADESVTATGQTYQFEKATGFLRTEGFGSTLTIGGGGNDSAQLFAISAIDRFVGRPMTAWMVGNNYRNRVVGFNHVHADANSTDATAHLFGGEGDEYLLSRQQGTWIRSGAATNFVTGFSSVAAELGQGGFDIAKLIDSEGDDRFTSSQRRAALRRNLSLVEVKNASRVVAVSENGGRDLLFSTDLEFELIVLGAWI